MARTPIKFEAPVPTPVTAAAEPLAADLPAISPQSASEVRADRLRLIAAANGPRGKIQPIPAEALEGLGMLVVGMVQIAADGTTQVVPVGLAPFAGSDLVEVPKAGFFLDELGRCGILLNGNDGAWQRALPEAVEEARRALGGATVS